HVRETASKALTVANTLCSLGNTVRGVKPNLLQQAISACVLYKAYYGAETWWLGRTRPGPSQISNRVGEHLEKLTKINPLQYAPWYPREPCGNAQARIGAPMGRTKEQAAANFMAFQCTIPSSDIVPGHAKIPENEAADLAAKEGAASIPPAPHKSSYALLKRYAKTQSLSAAQSQWEKVAPQSY
ncbi:hypothetical protein TSTA_080730, partial [Talaromyces stipitatus ATCC 10500]